MMSFERYMKDMIQPMRDELTTLGIKELRLPTRSSRTCLTRKVRRFLLSIPSAAVRQANADLVSQERCRTK